MDREGSLVEDSPSEAFHVGKEAVDELMDILHSLPRNSQKVVSKDTLGDTQKGASHDVAEEMPT